DFMFACAMYPGDKAFAKSVSDEAEFQVRRLSHHPSVVLWCGNNENSEGWARWGWQSDLGWWERRRVEKSYHRIFHDILPQRVEAYSDLPYWESSPMLGRGDPEHEFRGDAHYWGVWHDAEPFEVLEQRVPRFMSEFGFQSFPSMHTIATFTDTADLNLSNPDLLNHEKHPRGISLINLYMERDFGIVPQSVADYSMLSRFQQAVGIGKGLRAHRRSQPTCMGTLYWQLNDCWPVVSWSSMEYDGRKKPLHWEVKHVFAPQLLDCTIDSTGFKAFLIDDQSSLKSDSNSMLFACELVQCTLNGDTLKHMQWTHDYLGLPSEEVGNVPLDSLIVDRFPTSYYSLQLAQHGTKQFECHGLFASYKIAELRQPKIDGKVFVLTNQNQVIIAITADQYVSGLWFESKIGGTFSDNYIDLIPNVGKAIRFMPVSENWSSELGIPEGITTIDLEDNPFFEVQSINTLLHQDID
ncbi:MAG: hypothetical protein KDC12_12090, partial [Flavobacteriales bacterium]|nr:hypothetical protein [Flavobacteriales bacterium]